MNDSTIGGYIDAIKSDAPVPGGGTVSALSGAQGCALAAMVAGLTLGRKKYEQYTELCERVRERAALLSRELLDLAEQDAAAYAQVAAAMKLPRETDKERQFRKAELEKSNIRAAQVPYRVMELALRGLELCAELQGRSNTNAASDLEVAAHQLNACVSGAWANVLINLPGLSGGSLADRLLTEGETVLEDFLKLYQEFQQKSGFN